LSFLCDLRIVFNLIISTLESFQPCCVLLRRHIQLPQHFSCHSPLL
jgi:hypothetical protein